MVLPIDILFLIADYCDESTFHSLTTIEPELEVLRPSFDTYIQYVSRHMFDKELHIYFKSKYHLHDFMSGRHRRYRGWEYAINNPEAVTILNSHISEAIPHVDSEFKVIGFDDFNPESKDTCIAVKDGVLYYKFGNEFRFTRNFIWWGQWSFYDGKYIYFPQTKQAYNITDFLKDN